MITCFTVIRHGQTAANLAGILQGQFDTDLDELGIKQAECVANKLAAEEFDFIFASDLQRAMHTAQIIAEQLHLPAIPASALREWNLGDLQGRPVCELQKEYPNVLDAFKYEGGNFNVPGGESRENFYSRIAECLDDFAGKYAGKKLLLVTHAGVMRAIFKHIAGPVRNGALLPATVNASVSSFCNRDGEWQLRSWNDISHLANVQFRDSVTF